MCNTLISCKKIVQQFILIKICQKVHGYVLKRLAKFQQNCMMGNCFTTSQSLGMKTRFVFENTSLMNLVVQLILALDVDFVKNRHIFWSFVEFA